VSRLTDLQINIRIKECKSNPNPHPNFKINCLDSLLEETKHYLVALEAARCCKQAGLYDKARFYYEEAIKLTNDDKTKLNIEKEMSSLPPLESKSETKRKPEIKTDEPDLLSPLASAAVGAAIGWWIGGGLGAAIGAGIGGILGLLSTSEKGRKNP